ncbi:hypothetical protein [Thiohalocapsa sp. ML1]|uniref:hypothetical protein n=1 Tax=Thiohalocapsa sp. ML1 TaxID=1431688 RepID=UPI000A9E16DC|nr:hypothetical protein [Thiohalocapsa sp. ML1]
MSLTDHILVNAHYTRSVNLERDSDSPAVVRGYIPTPRALHTLARIADSLDLKRALGAWSLVGPYGVGKSTFAAFLTHLLGAPDSTNTQAAWEVLNAAEPDLAHRFRDPDRPEHGHCGHCVIVLTGSPEPFATRLTEALADGALRYWADRAGRRPAVIDALQRAATAEQPPTTSELMKLVAALQDAIARAGGRGLLLVIDELGKFLEYEARHSGANDIFLLQALAERTGADHGAKLTLLVLLHQSMDQYARGLGDTLRNEWTKVQGRFETIPFIESAEQVLRVVAAAFTHRLDAEQRAGIHAQALDIAERLASADALPKSLTAQSAAELFARCYPLHPLAALLLPLLCQKVAQNERTLFSYLGSLEPYGLGDSLSRLARIGDWILPWQIYEYFIRNQSAAVTDHYTRRRWTEVVTATERLGDAPPEQERLLKSIGLLNIVGAQGGLKASKDVVALCDGPPSTASAAIRQLIAKSVLQYRKFSGEYRVWEGSDFDLDAAVQEQVERAGRFNLASALNKEHALPPILGRRHAIQTGTLRYYLPSFADVDSFRRLPESTDTPRIIFFLIQNEADRARFNDEVLGYFKGADILVACPDADRLRQVIAEVTALERVRREAQALNTDPVAQREYKDRLAVTAAKRREILRALSEDPRAGVWYWRGRALDLATRRDLQSALSRILDEIYHASPTIKNELINRDKPSSQAAAARNRLLAAMLRRESDTDLGIEKFPPERAIYLALLREPGIHRPAAAGDQSWAFSAPTVNGTAGKRAREFRFGPVWQRIAAFMTENEQAPAPFSVLDALLQAPPYGIKRGVLPILYLAGYLVYQDECALFEEGRYIPYLTEEQIERFVRRPGDFAVQSFRIEGLRASLFREYLRLMFEDPQRGTSVLTIARPLAKFMGDLPEYANLTKRVSQTAQRVRSVFAFAKSPHALLFEELPIACGLETLAQDNPDEAALRKFADRLKQALRELKSAFPDLLQHFQGLMAQAFNLDRDSDLAELRVILRGRLDGLDRYTIDADGLRAFIRRLTKDSGTDEEWFANVLLFLGQKPAKKWNDADSEGAEYRLAEFTRRVHDIETLRVHYDRNRHATDTEFDVVLLRSLRKGGTEHEQVVFIDHAARTAIKTVREQISEQIRNLPDPSLRYALLAELTEELLQAREDQLRSTADHGSLQLSRQSATRGKA